jgi:hypothetical protein
MSILTASLNYKLSECHWGNIASNEPQTTINQASTRNQGTTKKTKLVYGNVEETSLESKLLHQGCKIFVSRVMTGKYPIFHWYKVRMTNISIPSFSKSVISFVINHITSHDLLNRSARTLPRPIPSLIVVTVTNAS